jgi:predicted nucleic acid-binding protein
VTWLTVPKRDLGPADRLHVGTCRSSGVDTIVTADSAFEGLPGLRRVDPLDPTAIRKLLSDS